jgi:hypothetical protein
LVKEAAAMWHTEDGQRILDNIRKLRQHFEPETLVMETERPRQAKAA